MQLWSFGLLLLGQAYASATALAEDFYIRKLRSMTESKIIENYNAFLTLISQPNMLVNIIAHA